MKMMNKVFDRMDSWRHLPSYQLERRADLFFSLYLPEVLRSHLDDMPINEQIIPEFPVRIGTIDAKRRDDDQSYKVDYAALSNDGKTAILVELKTEMNSKNRKQNDYLDDACKVVFSDLLCGIIHIFRVTTYKRKYFYLLSNLEKLGLIHIPQQMKDIASRSRLQGITNASQHITIQSRVNRTIKIYIQPEKEGRDTISFDDFRAVVQKHADPISKRFAQSLRDWALVPAGENCRDNH